VKEKVLSIVAEKTGYPEDMLDLDLDLEADLGIDTVKQAETFAAIRAAFNIPRRDDLKLRDYPTLSHVIKFVHAMRPDLAANGQSTWVSQPPASTAAPVMTTDSPLTADPVKQKVLNIVAEKTGYPQDMLDLDLDLEADLGVDTVKQADTFAAIRAAFDIPRQDNLKLRDYPTLSHVVKFVHDMRPDLVAGGQPTTASQQPAPTTAPLSTVHSPLTIGTAKDKLLGNIAEADRIPRRVPVPSLRPALDLCKPTGVTLDEKSRVVVMPDRGGIGEALVNRLEQRGVTALVIDGLLTGESIEAQLKTWLAEGSIQGVYWLAALDVEPGIEEIDLETWRELNRRRVKNLYTTLRALYESVSRRGSFLVSATRLGGLHGYGEAGASAPLGGAVAGFTKAYKRERNDALVKVVDFEMRHTMAEPADTLIAETLNDPGSVEVGYWDGQRYAIALEQRPAADGRPGMTLNKDSVFLITGAAGGITSAIVADLAAASGGVFYLVDLVREPQRDDPNIKLFRTDKEALKQKLIEAMKAAGERPTPVKIDKQMLAVERDEAALRAIESVETAGGTAHYYSVNLLDGPAVTAVIDDIRRRHGRIDVLMHAGGLEISRSLPDKEPKEFDRVFDVKADGFFNLLRAAKGLPIGASVSFSSVAGRFGNSGQTDYSAANDLLCKITSSLRAWRPDTRGIVIDWTAWGGIGMATRGSIPRIMEMAGIDLLPPEAGVPTVRRELTAGGTHGEVVIGQRLGILLQEWDETGGIDTAKVEVLLAGLDRPRLMIGKVKAAKLYGGLEVETTLDPQVQPFLFDHQLEGIPLLPGVMGTEAFAELASLLAPGTVVAAVENEQFLSPFKFYHHHPRTMTLSATINPSGNGDLIAHTMLQSVTQPPRLSEDRKGEASELTPQVKTHFTTDVRLTRTLLDKPVQAFEPPGAEQLPIGASQVYRIYFHGPAYKVLERAKVDGDTAIGLMPAALPPNTSPDGAASLMAPRLIELCFQTAGIWEIATKGVLALPSGIESVTTYRHPDEANRRRLWALVTAVDGGARFNARVVDDAGEVYVSLNGYRTVQLPGNVSL
jgi:NAD(P)-dependent dehydrogenase (short-subunit alcohol dehydrogenase family)/acyl carrier protein